MSYEGEYCREGINHDFLLRNLRWLSALPGSALFDVELPSIDKHIMLHCQHVQVGLSFVL